MPAAAASSKTRAVAPSFASSQGQVSSPPCGSKTAFGATVLSGHHDESMVVAVRISSASVDARLLRPFPVGGRNNL
eukprot:8303239-Lingulodinium_polyedra.AAC.1